MLEIMDILPVQINDTHNDSCGDDVHDDHDDDDYDDQEVGCTLNVDGTLVAQLPPLNPGKTYQISIHWEGGGGQP